MTKPAPLTYARAMAATRTRQTIGALAIAAMSLTSCSSDPDNPVAGDGRTAAVYESILDWMLDEEPDVGTGERPEWVIFVASRSETPIDIDVQVAVVDALDERISVRFIDERTEAVDVDSDDQPVRDGGILVGLGAVPQEGDSIDVYTDRYRNTDDVEAWLMNVERSGDSWAIAGTPTSTDVRPLPADA